MTRPIDMLLPRLQKVTRTGNVRWRGCCPGHDDRNPSLDIALGEDGVTVLLKCRSQGCSPTKIMQAVGLEVRDLFPDGTMTSTSAKKPIRREGTNGKATNVWSKVADYIMTLASDAQTETYDYLLADGSLAFKVVRIDFPNGRKRFSQFSPVPGGFIAKGMAGPRPLYRLPHLADLTKGQPVYLLEGERCVHASESIGLTPATTSSGGSNSAKGTGFGPLAGLDVTIFRDNDEAGMKYADAATKLLHAIDPPARVKTVALPGLPVGGDLVDFIAAHDSRDSDEIRRMVKEIADATDSAEPESLDVTETATTFPPSEGGNAKRLVQVHGQDLRYCFALRRWFVWDGKRWCEDDGQAMAERAQATIRDLYLAAGDKSLSADERRRMSIWALRSDRAHMQQAMTTIARSEDGIPVKQDELDRDPMALNVSNGTIDLQTGKLQPHRRVDLLTKIAPVDYDPMAESLVFDRFINEIFDGDAELIAFVQRWLGHALTADISEQFFPIFWGRGANGKSTLLDVVTLVMGDYAAEAPPDLISASHSDRHPTELADLCGRRLIVASETDENRRLRIGLVKKMTGDTTIKARRMRQDFFSFNRTHKIILMTNNKPVIAEQSVAIWRRVLLVPFGVVIPEQRRDARLAEKLLHERSGILRWLVDGCLAWRRNGLRPPKCVKLATTAYREEEDRISEWLATRCNLDIDDSWTDRTTLFTDYLDWSKTAGELCPLGNKRFYRRLRDRCGDEVTRKGVRGFSKISLHQCWSGVQNDSAPSGCALRART